MNNNLLNDTIKITLGFVVIVIIILFTYYKNYNNNNVESFNLVNLNKQIDIDINNNLRYNYKYNIIQIDELTFKLFKIAKKDKQLLKIIKKKLIKIYGEIKKNGELKSFLKFNNLINNDGLPIFINEHSDNLLLNEIKILLITMPKKEFELINI